jgi:hypothetical protein
MPWNYFNDCFASRRSFRNGSGYASDDHCFRRAADTPKVSPSLDPPELPHAFKLRGTLSVKLHAPGRALDATDGVRLLDGCSSLCFA